MDKIVIIGGKTLNGKIKISGSKNSALPILASSLLTKDKVSISNIPNLSDVTSMFDLLKSLNVNIRKKANSTDLTSSKPDSFFCSL